MRRAAVGTRSFVAEWPEFPRAIALHDTFVRVLQVVDQEQLIGAFTEWLSAGVRSVESVVGRSWRWTGRALRETPRGGTRGNGARGRHDTGQARHRSRRRAWCWDNLA